MERKSLMGKNVREKLAGMQLPVGFRFRPTDEVLLSHYLKPKAMSLPLSVPFILNFDVLNSDPFSFPGDMEEKMTFYFCKGKGGLRSKSAHFTATGCGFWKTNGKVKQIMFSSGGGILGTRKLWAFYQKDSGLIDWSRTSWVMHALQLLNSNQGLDGLDQEWRVFMVFQRKMRNANNNNKQNKVNIRQLNNCKCVDVSGSELLAYIDQKIEEQSSDDVGLSHPYSPCCCSSSEIGTISAISCV